MKLIIGLILGAILLGIALVSLAGGFDLLSRRGMSDDVIASWVIGGLMLVAGTLTVWASIKAHKRRRAAARGEATQDQAKDAGAVLFGVGMATLTDDFDDGGAD